MDFGAPRGGADDTPIEGVYVIEIEVTGATRANVDTLMEQIIDVVDASPCRFEGASGGPHNARGSAMGLPRHIEFNPNPFYSDLPGLLDKQAREGFHLLRVVPVDQWRAIAVFEYMAEVTGDDDDLPPLRISYPWER